MKALIYSLLAFGMTVLGIWAGLSMQYFPSHEEIINGDGVVYNLHVNKTLFNFQVAESEKMYAINSDVSTYSDEILAQLRNLKENDHVTLRAYQDALNNDGILTVVELSNNNSTVFNEQTFKQAQKEGSYYAFGFSALMFLCFVLMIFIHFKGDKIVDDEKSKLIRNLRR